jgi:hypothetical protein
MPIIKIIKIIKKCGMWGSKCGMWGSKCGMWGSSNIKSYFITDNLFKDNVWILNK